MNNKVTLKRHKSTETSKNTREATEFTRSLSLL